MERIKRCPNCGTNNTASHLFCEKCGADISRLSIEFNDSEAEMCESSTSNPAVPNMLQETDVEDDLNYVKVCRYCGKVSACNELLCTGCGLELTPGDIVDTEGKISSDYVSMLGKNNSSKYNMTIVSGSEQLRTMRLFNGLSVFGRKHLDEYENKLSCYQYISEIHCLVSLSDDTIAIADVSLNGTFLNNQRIAGKTVVGDNSSVDICDKKCLSLLFQSNET